MKQLLFSSLFLSSSLFSAIYHQTVETKEQSLEWCVDGASQFDELVVSWNAHRPELGEYAISVRVKTTDWTEYLPYAVWGATGQRTFTSTSAELPVRTNEDTLEILNGSKASGFCVKVHAQNGAKLDGLWALHASTCDLKPFLSTSVTWQGGKSIALPVVGRSQMALDHPQNMSLCSPTATSCVVSFLLGLPIQPLDFATKVWDEGFDIYGNWIFNLAESASLLQKPWVTYLARLDSFDAIYANLEKGVPSIVSVKGPLQGSIHPYQNGHLIAIIGYDAEKDRILCMDPAYPTTRETLVSYDREDFLRAWARRGRVAYLFEACSDIAN